MAENALIQFKIDLDSFLELSSYVSMAMYNFLRKGMYFLAKFLNPAFDLLIAGFAEFDFIHKSIKLVSP